MEAAPVWRLDWDESLSVGIPEIDVEHQRFIELINELNESIVGRAGMKEIRSRMQAILDDAMAHFAHEEDLFRIWNYPDAEEHARRHVQLTHALREIMNNFERGGLEYELIEAGLKVKAALIEHLLKEDMKYCKFCLVTGIGG